MEVAGGTAVMVMVGGIALRAAGRIMWFEVFTQVDHYLGN